MNKQVRSATDGEYLWSKRVPGEHCGALTSYKEQAYILCTEADGAHEVFAIDVSLNDVTPAASFKAGHTLMLDGGYFMLCHVCIVHMLLTY